MITMVVVRKKVSGRDLSGVENEELMLNLKVHLQILLDDPTLPSFHRRFLKKSLKMVQQMMGEEDYSLD